MAGLAASLGSGAMTNSIGELENAKCVFIIGSNTTEAHPVIATVIKRAAKKGATVIVADPRRIDIARHAKLYLPHRPGTDIALVNAMMCHILAEGLQDRAFVAERTENFDEFFAVVKDYTPERAELVTGVPAADIREAARLYATSGASAICYAMGITQHVFGTDNVKALANLAMLCGMLGKKNAGVNPLRGQNNVQGACDMGGLPDVFPGYQKVADDAARAKFEEAWGVPLPDKPGKTLVEFLKGVEDGTIKGMLIVGENPMMMDPNLAHTEHALRKLEFLAVVDILPTQTTALAHVVLPGRSFAEKDGTFTNTERRVQLVRRAIGSPGGAMAETDILCALAARLGQPWQYENAAQVLGEVALLTPSYGGISHARLGYRGLQWPCPTAEHPGTPTLHVGKFTRGLGRFAATPLRDSAEMPDAEYPYVLTTGRYLEQYHSGVLTRRVSGMDELCPPGTFEINAADAAREGIADGQWVTVASRRGRVRARAAVTDKIRAGVVFMAMHFQEAAANALTNDALDPVSKIPQYKVCAVRLARAEG